MPFDGSGNYNLPVGTTAISGNVIASAQWNTFTTDLVSVLNASVGIIRGGTGATTATGARESLGVKIGTDVQGHSATLSLFSALSPSAGKLPYFTGSTTIGLADLSPFMAGLLGSADGDALKVAASIDDPITYAPVELGDINTGTDTTPGVVSAKTIADALGTTGWQDVATWSYVTDVSEIAFTDLGGYREIRVVFDELNLAANSHIGIHISQDGGLTYANSGYSSQATFATSVQTSTGEILLAVDGATSFHNGNITLFNVNDSNTDTFISGQCVHSVYLNNFSASAGKNSPHNAFRLFSGASGSTVANFTGGKIHVFGRN